MCVSTTAIFINRTKLYPAEDSRNCLASQTEEFCSKIKADINKIEGWSIVNITDDTIDPRSAVTIEIVGTTMTPEFASGMPLLIVAPITAASVMLARFKKN